MIWNAMTIGDLERHDTHVIYEPIVARWNMHM